MRHQAADERQRDGDVAAKAMAERQINHRALRLGEQRVVLDDVVGAGKVAAMRAESAFRLAGGARRIDDERGPVGRELARQPF